jgi:hypothetical protein
MVQEKKRDKDQRLNGGVMEWIMLKDMSMSGYSVREVFGLPEMVSLDAELLDD